MALTCSHFGQCLIVGFKYSSGSLVVKVLNCAFIIPTGFGRLCFRTSFSEKPFSLYTTFIIITVGSRALAGSELELFLEIVNGFQMLALVISNSVFDLAGLLDPFV